MVAVRGRLSALALTFMMLSTSIALVAPEALAQAPPANMLRSDGTAAGTGLLAVGTAMKVAVSTTLPQCGAGLGGVPAASDTTAVSASLAIQGQLAPANPAAVSLVKNAQSVWTGVIPFQIRNNQNPGIENPAADFPVTLSLTCPAGTTNPGPITLTTAPAINVDTQAPTIAAVPFSSMTLVHDPAFRAKIANTFLGNAEVASVGSTVKFTPTVTGATAFKWDLSAFNTSAGQTLVTPNTELSFVVKEGGTHGFAAINNVSKTIVLNASDDAGNSVEVPTAGILTDNVLPTPSDFVVMASNVTRRPAEVELNLTWSGNGPAEDGTIYARVDVIDQDHSGVTRTLGFIPREAVNVAGRRVFTNADLALTDTINSWFRVFVTPVDSAGNMNTAAGVVKSPNFASNMTIHYGGVPAQPAIVAGTGMRNVYVNISTNGPTATPAGDQIPVFGQLARVSSATPVFWKVNTAGSAIGDFGPQQLRPSLAEPTAFRPSAGPSTPDCPPGVVCYVMTSLTESSPARNFLNGPYELWINASSPGANRTRVVIPLGVDSLLPKLGDLGMPVLGTGQIAHGPDAANTTGQIHGMDGNPFRVKVNATDWARTDSEGVLDTGLRNVTIQLVDSATLTNVVRTIEIDPRSCTTVLAYCVTSPATNPGACPTSPPSMADPKCIYQELSAGRWNTTFANGTVFHGWVNTTFPDLPVGNYSIRVLAYDNAGLAAAPRVYGTPTAPAYRVRPAVAIDLTPAPLVTTEGKLEVAALASQYFPTTRSDRGCVSPTSTNCAAEKVRIYVSNVANDASGGILYDQRFYFEAGTTAEQVEMRGYSGVDNAPANGALTFTDALTFTLFPYTAAPRLLSPLNIDPNVPVYVRAEATGVINGAEVSQSSGWVRATSATAPALNITEPALEWSLNLSTQFDGIGAGGASEPRGPHVNITFDRKADVAAPVLNWSLYQHGNLDPITGAPKALIGWANGSAPEKHGGLIDAKVKFNWTFKAVPDGAGRLGVGSYTLVVRTFDATSGAELAWAYRNFSVLAGRPTLTVDPASLTSGIAKKGSTYYASPEFDMRFTVHHGAANLTALSQLNFTLTRGGASAAVLKPGEQDFDVTVIPDGLDPSFEQTSFFARVRLPPGAADAESYQLNLTAEVDVAPYRVGHATDFLNILIDKQPPAGHLLVADSEHSVLQVGSSPPLNKATPKPAFVGFAEDRGAGIRKVEVRVIDLTLNETIRFTTDTTFGYLRVPGVSEDWLDSSTPGVLMTSAGADQDVERVWTIPLTGRSGLPDLWRPGDAQPGIINLSHKYRIDVRVTDKLGRVMDPFNSTVFDFDAAPPLLGYGGSRLDTPGNIRSGINAVATQVNWHGSLSSPLNVSVTDNHCLVAVRLKGYSEHAPTIIQSANMSPTGYTTPTSRFCYAQMPATSTGPQGPAGIKYIKYELDLANAPQLTDIVGNYTYWFEAEDEAGQISEIPSNFRTFRMRVLDNAPAVVRSLILDPSPGQAGGRTLVKADVFDNLQVSHVDVTFHDLNTLAVLKTARMRADNVSATGSGIYVADTETDLNLTLEIRDYLVNVTAYDVNWNRSAAQGGPTCPQQRCTSFSPTIYRVRDDGEPAVVLQSPSVGSTVNGTPTFTLRALHKNLDAAGVTIVAGMEGEEASIAQSAYNLTALTSGNGSAQGFTITYSPANLTDGGNYTLNVSARVSGLTNATSFQFVVDAQPPTVTANLSGTQTIGDKQWATEDTRVVLIAEDNVSSVTTFYSVNGGAAQTYSAPITPAGPDGEWKLEYWATDAAGNSAPRASLTLQLDQTGPKISISKHGDELLLTVTDAGVGLNESSITVHYRYGDAIAFTTKLAEKVAGNGYTAVLPGNATATGLAYYVSALDVLGSAGHNYTATQPYVISKPVVDGGGEEPPPVNNNFPPTITITQPATGASVRGTLDLKWLAEDPEGEPLAITIALRDPAPGRVLVTAGENSGSYKVDLAGQSAGAYTIVVTASDGEHSASAQVTFNVESGETIQIRDAPPATVQPNGRVSVAVSITPIGKTVTQANYRIVKDGQLYSAGRLTSAEGLFATAFNPAESGAYRVLVDVQYSDGTTDTSKQVASFSVAGDGSSGTARTFPVSLMVLAAVGVLTIALAGYGAFGRWRK